MKKPRTLKDLLTDPRVLSYSDERNGWCNDGLWLYLMPGWFCELSCSNTVHEFSVKECCEALHEVRYAPEQFYDVAYLPREPRKLLPAG